MIPIEENISSIDRDFNTNHSGDLMTILRLKNKAQLGIYDYQYISTEGPLEKSYSDIGLTSDQVVSNISGTNGSQVDISSKRTRYSPEVISREPTSHNKTNKDNCDQNDVKHSVIRAATTLLLMKKGTHTKIPTAKIIWIKNPNKTSQHKGTSTLNLSRDNQITSEDSGEYRETSLYPQTHETWVGNQRRFRRNPRSQKRIPRKRSFSETKEYRLLQTYLKVLDTDGNIRRVKAALDTQSNVSYAEPYLGTTRP